MGPENRNCGEHGQILLRVICESKEEEQEPMQKCVTILCALFGEYLDLF